MNALPAANPVLSIVIPVLNEAANIAPMVQRVRAALDHLGLSAEILFVDDGSTDGTAAQVRECAQRLNETGGNLGADAGQAPTTIRVISLSRNFGHQAALVAGLEHSRGAAVITLDGDLQHPPELIPELVERWRAGYEVVQTIRREPADANPAKRVASKWFYRLLSRVSRIQVTPGAADFRLLSRDAVNAFLQCRERSRFNRGLVQWIGFRYCEVPYDAALRHAGRSKYSLRAMLRLAGDAIFSFSSLPLRIAGLAGVCVSLAAAVYLVFVLWARLFTSYVVPGWSSILAAVLILGGMNLIVLWILGEYVGRLYEEVKQRPIYIIRPDQTPPAPANPSAASPPRADSQSLRSAL